ncbi:winged helix-turn-helix transcriptional regulator [Shewanella canadensis]|uniref:Winged helix-turn-helix transcriptional regulator n=1 Tax=Shewanella canadensis TaxID=271096 RepID=A0A3S0KS19_9GAMM|nr:winged helix-turn-helix transcriptional regulator [Shewanella canadensis]
MHLKANPENSITKIAEQAGISRRSVNRILNNEEK